MNRLSKFLSNNKVLLIISILAAVALWMFVIGRQNPMTASTFDEVKIERTGTETMLADELKVISVSANVANVKITGRLSDISNVIFSDLSLTADLSGVTGPGTYEIPLLAHVRQSGIAVESVTPSSITVVADYIGKNRFQVDPVYTGTLPAGFSKGACQLDTNGVTIEGPAESLNKVKRVVVKIDLNGLKDSISTGYAPILLDENGTPVKDNELKVSSTEIWVELPILMEKEVAVDILLDGVTDPTGYTVKANPEKVIAKGKRSIMQSMTSISTEPVALPEQVQSTMMVKLSPPDGVSVEPSEVEIKITVPAQKRK